MKIEDAIKRYESWAEDDRIDVIIRKEHRQIADWLKELKANRPQGKWIDKGKNLWKCSNCEMVIYSESEQDRNEFHKWCSRCGARMKGADDEVCSFDRLFKPHH